MTSISPKCSLLMVGLTLSALLCGCIKQFIPQDGVARFGTDRKFPDLNYTGDGNFTDYGRMAGILRFVLDLGAVDLKKENLRKFELKGLPEVEFVCYLRVDHPLPVLGRPKDFKAGDLVVEMALEDQDGKVVFRNEAPLNRWVWSGSVGAAKSDLYMSNAGQLVVDENGELTLESEEGDASKVNLDLPTRKTIFTPEQGKSYRISTKIAEGNIQAPKAQLLLMGGGWKVGN